jgi:hypothetical protein
MVGTGPSCGRGASAVNEKRRRRASAQPAQRTTSPDSGPSAPSFRPGMRDATDDTPKAVEGDHRASYANLHGSAGVGAEKAERTWLRRAGPCRGAFAGRSQRRIPASISRVCAARIFPIRTLAALPACPARARISHDGIEDDGFRQSSVARSPPISGR